MTSYTYYKLTTVNVTYYSILAEVYNNFITVKSDLQLNLKVAMVAMSK